MQNLLVMRFTNQLLSSVWNNKNISNIQITMKEDFGTQGRGGYYDSFGVIRDVIQNHLLQVRCFSCFLPPAGMLLLRLPLLVFRQIISFASEGSLFPERSSLSS